jgi:hypothetical protein
MTNEEMERAIDFLLKSQASFEARQQQYEAERAQRQAERARLQAEQARRDARLDAQFELTNQQIAETEKKLGVFADIQADMMRVMTCTFEEQARVNEEQRKFKQSVRAAEKLQSEFNLSVMEAQKLQGEFNQSVRESGASQKELNEALAAALARLAESQAHADRRLDALIDIVRGGAQRRMKLKSPPPRRPRLPTPQTVYG